MTTETTTSTTTTTTTVVVGDDDLGTVTITRIFNAPRELVYAAMLDPQQLTKFWGPTGISTPLESIVIEAWVGGRFETLMVMDDGSGSFPSAGTFTELEEPSVIAFGEVDGMVTRSTYTDLGDGRTEVVITQTNVPAMYRADEALAGFITSLDRFDAYLATIV